MMSSPKDQEQGNRTEKQAHPIPVYDQLDYRHKQQPAPQEYNAVHSASSRGIFPHVDVQHPSGRLDQSVLILALPLNLPAHLAIRHAVYGFPILNGVIMFQNVGHRIVGVVYHPVGVHAVEVVLEVWQEQGAHAHRVDEHILSTLNIEEADIDPKADEPIRALDLMGAHILCQKQLAAVLEIECFA